MKLILNAEESKLVHQAVELIPDGDCHAMCKNCGINWSATRSRPECTGCDPVTEKERLIGKLKVKGLYGVYMNFIRINSINAQIQFHQKELEMLQEELKEALHTVAQYTLTQEE